MLSFYQIACQPILNLNTIGKINRQKLSFCISNEAEIISILKICSQLSILVFFHYNGTLILAM